MSRAAETRFTTPAGVFTLCRYPLRKRELLRAWDAADEYLLEHCSALPPTPGSLLILNDAFGALTLPMASDEPVVQSDSQVALTAIEQNLKENGVESAALSLLPSTSELPARAYDRVLIRVPKTLSLLESQLRLVARLIRPGTQVIGYGMAKYLNASVFNLFETLIGPTRGSLAKKKARLIFSTPDASLGRCIADQGVAPDWYRLDEYALDVCCYPNLFSRGRLDPGTRLLLDRLPADQNPGEIVDLGCGSGILGVVAGRLNPHSRVHFVDESHYAVASARETARAAGLTNTVSFRVDDGMQGYPRSSVDLVLCNPPYHQQHTMGDFIARRMMLQARRALRRGGELWIVGNRHLAYHKLMKRLFGNVQRVANDHKFVVLKSVRQAEPAD